MPVEVINISGARQHNLKKLHVKRFTSARIELRSKWISAINGPAAAGKVARPFEGLVPQMQRLYEQTKSEFTRNRIRSFMTYEPCKVCNGARLKPEILDPLIHKRKELLTQTPSTIFWIYFLIVAEDNH